MHISHVIKQKSYEKIEHILRRHPFTFVPVIITHVILFSVPFFFYFMGGNLFPSLFQNSAFRVAGVLLGSSYLLGILMFFYTSFTEFYLDLWIITNDRMIDIEQFGLFSRRISELDLFQIQDITTDVHGVFPTMLHYGNLTVKTASMTSDIVFRNISQPDNIRHELLRLADIDRRYHTGTVSTTSSPPANHPAHH